MSATPSSTQGGPRVDLVSILQLTTPGSDIRRSDRFGRVVTRYLAGGADTAGATKAAIDGKLGTVLGKAQGDDGRWSYGVFVYDQQLVWSFWEDELTSTGEFDRRESFYSGESLRVSRHGEVLG